jgi:hypothetical protein
MTRQLRENHAVDIYNDDFVRGVYDLEIKRFRDGIFRQLYEKNRERYDDELLRLLQRLTGDSAEHLRRSINHIAKARKKQVVITIDNADQRSSAIQEESFILAQTLATSWEAVVFIAVRPQTYHRTRRAGKLSAYPQKIFTISPPRVDLVVRKRLEFALKIAEGRLPIEKLHGIKVELGNIATFFRALLYSLGHNAELNEMLTNITGSNIRLLEHISAARVVFFAGGWGGPPRVP